jgi:glycosyltransferase involved in cell wall biosynthesis
LNPDVFEVTLVSSRQIAHHYSQLPLKKIIFAEDLGMGIWFDTKKALWHDIRIAAALIADEKPDIAFGMMHYMSTVLVLAKKLFRLNCKVVASPRGPSTYYLKTCFPKWTDRVYLRFLFSLLCRYADEIIVPSAGTKRDCVDYFRAGSEKVTVINNSIDADEVAEKGIEDIVLPIPEGAFVISTAGRLSEEKNMVLLLKAFSLLRRDIDAWLMIIGDGGERQRLEEFAGELKVRDRVVFTGFQKNPYKFISRSHVFVHTCLFEGFGNIMVEAMACGVPVIATDCPYGPGEIIEHGRSGLLVPVDESEVLAEEIAALLKDDARRKALSEKGIERAKYFSVERMVRAYEECLMSVARPTG